MKTLIKTQTDHTVISKRLERLKNEIENYPKSICIERAMLVTEYFRNKKNRKKPMAIQKAEALSLVLTNKSVKIYPDELIVGTTTSKRVAGPIYPELHGMAVMEDLLKFTSREVNPLVITKEEKLKLLRAMTFWLNKFLVYRSFKGIDLVSFLKDQLNPKFYLLNESGGIGHFVADYETLINTGIDGIKDKIKSAQLKQPENNDLYEAMLISLNGVLEMAEKHSLKALELAHKEKDTTRKEELLQIAENLRNVPKRPASTFYEAVQSIWMLHTAFFLEGLDNGISFGRMDHYLLPFYERDLEKGILTREKAKEILGSLAVKSSEIIPVFNSEITNSHGGFLSGQGLTIGGIDKNDNDITNELSFIFLELMDEVRLRQPNYHARLHQNSPAEYKKKIMSNLSKGVNSPALFNDDVIIKSLKTIGFDDEDAKEYTTLGCVEINAPGKTLGSTDAALVNLPICLEMALNKGYLYHKKFVRDGAKTAAPESFKNIEEVKKAYRDQLQFLIDDVVNVLASVETGNRKYHPTPLTSSFIQGCIEKGKDVTEGGAIYNLSGVQGVGVSDVGDSLYAIDELVFKKKKYTLDQIVSALKTNFKGNEKLKQEMLNTDKFGNDIEEVDSYTSWVANTFYDSFNGKKNTRGGDFVAGYYSTTTHNNFGKKTGALPSGRVKGQTFTSGIAPMNGFDKKGPTACFNSIASIDYTRAHNGINVNAKFDNMILKGEQGKKILENLLMTYFKKGGMQIQLNVLDSKMLIEAKDNPDKYPWLIVRVSGYSAYFNDLSPDMKEEIIQRSTLVY
jgi:formate C-acetyltransferase